MANRTSPFMPELPTLGLNNFGRPQWKWSISRCNDVQDNRFTCPYCAYRAFRIPQVKNHFFKSHIHVEAAPHTAQAIYTPQPLRPKDTEVRVKKTIFYAPQQQQQAPLVLPPQQQVQDQLQLRGQQLADKQEQARKARVAKANAAKKQFMLRSSSFQEIQPIPQFTAQFQNAEGTIIQLRPLDPPAVPAPIAFETASVPVPEAVQVPSSENTKIQVAESTNPTAMDHLSRAIAESGNSQILADTKPVDSATKSVKTAVADAEMQPMEIDQLLATTADEDDSIIFSNDEEFEDAVKQIETDTPRDQTLAAVESIIETDFIDVPADDETVTQDLQRGRSRVQIPRHSTLRAKSLNK